MKSRINRLLVAWFEKNQRPLPWRKAKPNPYHVWLAEIMLQQTQVETMLPYYLRFLKVYPSVQALAKLPVEKVVRLWSGLGYYARARNLHRAAQIVVERGGFPQTKAEWLKLPGVGEYTAGAIASIVFGERVPVVDGNVARVLTRLFALKGDPKKNPLKKRLWELAAGLVPDNSPGNFNQALMELGALVCLPQEPKCGICPVRKVCLAFRQNRVDQLPTPLAGKPVEKVRLQASLIEKNGRYLLAKRDGRRHFQSMWEFPQLSPRQMGIEINCKSALPSIQHSIMNRSITLKPYRFEYLRGRPRKTQNYVAYRWIRLAELKNYPASSLNHKIIKGFWSTEIPGRGGGRKEGSGR